jgi:hypothetical protein
MGQIRHTTFSTTPSKLVPFTTGTRVQLKLCPGGEPGVVLKIVHRRIEVSWPGFHYTGRHDPRTLLIVGPPPDPRTK